MAAGLSSRFAPISYERPKGTLKVRGEILVERQIRQLHEVGITNIALVVGYKKEYFFYLAASTASTSSSTASTPRATTTGHCGV